MSRQKDGGPAFPIPVHMGCGDENGDLVFPGLSIRDHFAGLAMQAALARGIDPVTYDSLDKIAHAAYVAADCMLKERDKS